MNQRLDKHVNNEQYKTYLSNFSRGSNNLAVSLQEIEDIINSKLSTTTKIQRITTGGNILDTFSEDSTSQDSSSSSTITGNFISLASNILNESIIIIF